MCQVCTDWEKGKLTTNEAWLNLNEMIDPNGNTEEELTHFFELANKISDKQVEEELES